MCHVYIMEITYTGVLAIKTKEIIPFAAAWMDEQIVIPNEVSQTEKEKCHMAALIFGL